MLHKQLIIFIGVILSVVVMGLLAKPVIRMWIGREVNVSYPLIVTIGIFVLVSTWNNIYAMFVNGIGDIKIQLYTAVVAMFLNIPLSIIFVKYLGFGLSGVVLGTIFSLSVAAVALPIQVNRIMRLGMRAIHA